MTTRDGQPALGDMVRRTVEGHLFISSPGGWEPLSTDSFDRMLAAGAVIRNRVPTDAVPGHDAVFSVIRVLNTNARMRDIDDRASTSVE